MKEIPLTRGYTTTVSNRDYPSLSKFRGHVLSSNTGPMYAARKVWRKGKRTVELMHRRILGVPPGVKVDHRNGCGLNNQRRNLRRATDQQNQRAFLTPRKQKTSRYRGVHFHRRTGKWQAQIALGSSRNTYLGIYNSQVAAAKAYDVAALKFFGKFAALNFKVNSL